MRGRHQKLALSLVLPFPFFFGATGLCKIRPVHGLESNIAPYHPKPSAKEILDVTHISRAFRMRSNHSFCPNVTVPLKSVLYPNGDSNPRPLDLPSEFTSPTCYQLSYRDKHNLEEEIKGPNSTQNRKDDRILKALIIRGIRAAIQGN